MSKTHASSFRPRSSGRGRPHGRAKLILLLAINGVVVVVLVVLATGPARRHRSEAQEAPPAEKTVRRPASAAPDAAGEEQAGEVAEDDGAEDVDVPDWSAAWLYITPNEAARRDQLLRARRTWSPSPRMSDAVPPQLEKLMALIDAGEVAILSPVGPSSAWDEWNLATRVRALLGQPGLDERRKVELGTAFLRALGLMGRDETAVDAAALWVDIGVYRAAVAEARWIGRTLPDFGEDQARRFARRFAGYVTGQKRLRELWAYRLADRPEELVAPLDDAIRRFTASKRDFMRQLLTPEQFRRLYDERHYDSEPFWRQRLTRSDRDE